MKIEHLVSKQNINLKVISNFFEGRLFKRLSILCGSVLAINFLSEKIFSFSPIHFFTQIPVGLFQVINNKAVYNSTRNKITYILVYADQRALGKNHNNLKVSN